MDIYTLNFRWDKIVLKKWYTIFKVSELYQNSDGTLLWLPMATCPTISTVIFWLYKFFQDHIALEDYEIHDGMNLELYYQ